jgi:hypothetical protein
MAARIPGIGMYQYLLPALSAWAVRMGYEIPDTEEHNLICYYTTDMDDTWRGTHQMYNSEKTVIKIRPGISNELSTWAHEFAHMIQSLNLGKQWRLSYDASSEHNGYYENVFEVEAREAGKMATIFEQQGWLFWEEDYGLEGEFSIWPKIKRSTRSMGGMYIPDYYYENRSYDIVPWYASDEVVYWIPARTLLNTLVKLTLELFAGLACLSHNCTYGARYRVSNNNR